VVVGDRLDRRVGVLQAAPRPRADAAAVALRCRGAASAGVGGLVLMRG